MNFLFNLDVTLFQFFNASISNTFFDMFFVAITDYDKNIIVRIVVLLFLIICIVRGDDKKRLFVVALIFAIFMSDQLNSFFIKNLFQRIRPCSSLENVKLLVECGSGFSFPSSHAVNNFTMASVVSFYFKKIRIPIYIFAFLVAFSRVYVGVHFPFDVLVGSILGLGFGYGISRLALIIYNNYRARND